MSEALRRLAALVGIEDGWWDFYGSFRPVSDDTRRTFLHAMGFAVADDGQAEASLRAYEERSWRRWLEPVQVAHEQDGPPEIAITVPAVRASEEIDWILDEEVGVAHGGSFRVADLPHGGEYWIEGRQMRRGLLRLPSVPTPGYHTFRIVTHDGAEAEMSLIVVPPLAFTPEHIERGGRVWGVQTQVYALRTDDDWGVGDFSALRDLAAGMAQLGAGTVGVNPLHALFANRPEHFGPYSGSSRAFLNLVYIDVEAIPDFADCGEARRMVADAEFQQALEALRGEELVDYVGLMRCKRAVLEIVYAGFRARHRDGDRGRAFRAFQTESGRAGELFATFEALQEHFLRQDASLGYWRHWPEEYRRPDSHAVNEFALAHRARVELYWYLQWQADAQLASVQAVCAAAGMPIGLYRDVGVGVSDDGAESWMNQEEMAPGVTIGAPPDPLAAKGQDWGLAPFNPVALRGAAYRPFIEMLRANMRHAGALRLDHAMQLRRLYWVPPGCGADQGAYVAMPARDLFGIVALESRRNRCLVVGEDLGTVPEGFRELMFGSGVYGYRLFVFERDHAGAFKPPSQFTEQALVAVGTHDLPSLRGYWEGTDVAERRRLQQYPRPEMADEEAQASAADRRRLVEALHREGMLSHDFPLDGGLGDEQVTALADAVHAYLERTPSRIMMVQIEDVLGLSLQFNLPGTTDQHPNWRRRYPLGVAAILGHQRMRETARRLLEHRSAPAQRAHVRIE